jgi:purine-binding chemotaxis protein CheW
MATVLTRADMSAPPAVQGLTGCATDTASGAREVLVFEVGGQTYGLPTADVRELVRAVAITPLPGAPGVIEGVVNVRGCVLPVLDVRARFRLPPKALDPSDHFIVASAGPRGVILRVDRATHLALVDEASVQPTEALGPAAAYVAGVARLEDGLVLIHDLRSFLSAAESGSLDEALCAPASP